MKDAALMCSSLCLLKKTERSWLHSGGGREANRLPLTAWHGPQPPSTSSLGTLARSSWLHPAVPAEAAQGCKWLYSQVRWTLKRICFSADEVSVFWKVGSYRVPEFRVFKTETLSPLLSGKQQWETEKAALLERGEKKSGLRNKFKNTDWIEKKILFSLPKCAANNAIWHKTAKRSKEYGKIDLGTK